MNIMKTNMLSLDDKFLKDETGNTTVITAPVPSEPKPQAGIKALSFLGMKNLMANPKLAQGIGVMNDKMAEASSSDSYVAPYSSNIAFKGSASVAKTAAVAGLLTLAAATLQSCKETIETKQEQIVYVDTKLLAEAISQGIASLQAEINSLKAQLAQISAEQASRDREIINALTNALNQLQSIYNKISQMGDKMDQQSLSFEEFKTMIYGQNSAIIDAIVVLQQVTKEEARAAVDRILEAYKNDLIDIKTAMAQIQDLLKTNNELLSEILKTLNQLKEAADKAALQRDSLISLTNDVLKCEKVSVAQHQMMMNQLGTLILQNGIQIQNQYQTIKAIRETKADLKATIYEVAEQLGVKVEALAEVITLTGKSLEQVMNMSKQEIMSALEANLSQLQNTNNTLINIENKISDIDQSVENYNQIIKDAAAEINETLNKISGQIDELSKLFANAFASFNAKLDILTNYAKGCYENGKTTNQMLAKLSQQLCDLKSEATNLKAIAIQIRDDIQNGVSIDNSQIQEVLNALNINSQASTKEIVAKLNEFIGGQERIEVAINKIGNETNSKLDYIACLIKNKTSDNADVIEAINNLAISNQTNIAAATEELASKLDVLISKVDSILNRMDDIAATLKKYGDQLIAKFDIAEDILAAIKANGAKIDIANMTLDELLAELAKIKPELQKLNNSATTANSYLDVIAKRQLDIVAEIQKIEQIGGGDITVEVSGGVTKEELDELWEKHNAKAYAQITAFLNSIHADDITKADEIIALIKKGNGIAGDTYQFLIEYANKNNLNAEQLKALLEAIYKYLPELKCNCNCQGDCDDNQGTHEGIIGDLT